MRIKNLRSLAIGPDFSINRTLLSFRAMVMSAVMDPKVVEMLGRTKTDISLFNKYILQDEDPPAWIPVMKEFFEGPYNELIALMGRKAGKSVRAAKVALFFVYKLLIDDEFKSHFKIIPGQPVYILIVSVTADQAENIILDYARTFAKRSWYLSKFIIDSKKDEMVFEGNIIVRAQGSSAKAMRGYPCIVIIFDELAHFVDTNGNASGKKVYEALKPNISIFGDVGKVLILTTPGPKSGIVWELVKAKDGGGLPLTLIKKAPTWEMNKTISKAFLDSERDRDPVTFGCEYGGEFYESIDAFLDPRKIDECIKLPKMILASGGPWEYYVTMDPGLKHNSYTVLLAHMEGDEAIVDYIKKFEGTKKEPVIIADVEVFTIDICDNYHVRKIGIDQHQSASTIQNLQKLGWPIEETPFTSQYNMVIYERLKRYVNGGKVKVPPYAPLIQELKLLQIRNSAGKFSVAAPRGMPDDAADCLANAIYMMTKEKKGGMLLV